MKINKFLTFLMAVMLPYIILMGGVRLVMNPTFPSMEYRRAGFPEDPVGFTLFERTKWSEYAVRYLTNNEDISYLGNLQDATGAKLYTPDELSHMEDVKKVVSLSSLAWYATIGLTIAVLLWFLIMKQWDCIRKAFNAGGWLTVALLGALLIFLAVRFDQLFEYFHRLFFADGTWTFSQSSTLIRLFPFVFWRDAFVLVFAFALVVGLILALLTRKRKPKVQAAGA